MSAFLADVEVFQAHAFVKALCESGVITVIEAGGVLERIVGEGVGSAAGLIVGVRLETLRP